jgi:hypothetical protein
MIQRHSGTYNVQDIAIPGLPQIVSLMETGGAPSALEARLIVTRIRSGVTSGSESGLVEVGFGNQ